jgi:hypothetical protein
VLHVVAPFAFELTLIGGVADYLDLQIMSCHCHPLARRWTLSHACIPLHFCYVVAGYSVELALQPYCTLAHSSFLTVHQFHEMVDIRQILHIGCMQHLRTGEGYRFGVLPKVERDHGLSQYN